RRRHPVLRSLLLAPAHRRQHSRQHHHKNSLFHKIGKSIRFCRGLGLTRPPPSSPTTKNPSHPGHAPPFLRRAPETPGLATPILPPPPALRAAPGAPGPPASWRGI